MQFVFTVREFYALAKQEGWPLSHENSYEYQWKDSYYSATYNNILTHQNEKIPLGEEHHPQLKKLLQYNKEIAISYIIPILNAFKYKKNGEEWLKKWRIGSQFFKSHHSNQWLHKDTKKTLFLGNKRITIALHEEADYLEKHGYYSYGFLLYNIHTDPAYDINRDGRIVPLSIIISSYVECPEDGHIHTEFQTCPICAERVKRLLKPYNYKAEEHFIPAFDKTILMGIELELENCTGKNLQEVNKIIEHHCITKQDGSLHTGMEIVSRPASISIQKECFRPLFDAMPRLALEAKSNCGIHIHIDKASLSQLQLGKINAFVYNNEAFIFKIAGRSNNSYAKCEDKRTVTYGLKYDDMEPTFYKTIKRSGGGKYQALNLDKPNTVEFRIFASTTQWDIFCKDMEFVQALVDYTAPGALSLTLKEQMEEANFVSFVNNNKKTYPNLFTFLKGN